MHTKTQWNAGLGAITLGGLAMLSPAAVEAKGISIRQDLVATGVDPDATGQVRVDIRDQSTGLRGRLKVKVKGLDDSTTFDVTVEGVLIGSFTTRRSGSGKVRFDTRPRGNDQLLGVDPRGKTVAVVHNQVAVEQATIPADTIDPNDVRCCLPDNTAPECEDRTPEECQAAGGVDLGPGSCLPNPCTGPNPPDADIRCCLPDASGAECEDRTPAECSAQGGINIGAGECVPNPCLPAPTTPTVTVTCERRSDRSRASVNGNDLNPGDYHARITSGANTATSGPQPTVGDEVESDFDSEPDDIAAGATAIAADFIQGSPPQLTGQILDASDAVVAEATVTCEDR